MKDAPKAVQDLFEQIMGRVQRTAQDRELARIRSDPKAHKLTRLMADGKSTSYRYVPAGVDGWNRTVWFCWSCHRNAAGYFLGWREVTRRDGTGKRDQWVARRVRKRAKELAMRRANRFKARQAERKN